MIQENRSSIVPMCFTTILCARGVSPFTVSPSERSVQSQTRVWTGARPTSDNTTNPPKHRGEGLERISVTEIHVGVIFGLEAA